MKTICLSVFLFFYATLVHAQKVTPIDTIKPGKGPREKQLEQIKNVKVKLLSDSTGNQPKKNALIDTTIHNKYGDLLDDDINYNKRYSVGITAAEVVGINVVDWSVDKFLLHKDYANISTASWRYNIKNGWEWDRDKFGINFIG